MTRSRKKDVQNEIQEEFLESTPPTKSGKRSSSKKQHQNLEKKEQKEVEEIFISGQSHSVLPPDTDNNSPDQYESEEEHPSKWDEQFLFADSNASNDEEESADREDSGDSPPKEPLSPNMIKHLDDTEFLETVGVLTKGDAPPSLPSLINELEKRKKYKNFLILLSSSILFFVIFLYFFFPYHILKHWAVFTIDQALSQNQSGLRVDIESLRPYWITGVKIKNLELINLYAPQHRLKLDYLKVHVSPFALLAASLKVSVKLDQKNGKGVIQSQWSLFDLLKGQPLPSTLNVQFSEFDITSIFTLAIQQIINSNNQLILLVKPLLESLTLTSRLDGQIQLKVEKKVPMLKAQIKLPGLTFRVDDPSMSIANQIFEKSQISFTTDHNVINLQPGLQLESPDFGLHLAGRIVLPSGGNKGELNLDMDLKMLGDIQKHLSILKDTLNCGEFNSEGRLKRRLVGDLSSLPRCESQ